MKAIILAGGVGTRLRPLSCTRPKLLFPVLNKPLLDWTLERLAENGVDGVTLAVKYMAEAFMQRYGESKHGVKISYSLEKKSMRTGGAIKYAEESIGYEEPFLALNGDIFTTIDYTALINKHKQNKAVATIALYRVADPSRYGTAKLTEENRITQFVEKAPPGKAPSNLINAGVYVLDPEIFNYIPAGRPVSIESEVFPKLAKEGKLFGHKFKEIWIDIGKPADYLKANRVMLDAEPEKRLLRKDASIDKAVKFIDPVRVDGGVTVGQNTKLGPYVILGRDAVLGRNVTLENSVVFPEAAISDHASVRGAVIGEGATIGKGATVMEGCIIGDYVIIRDNVTLSRNVTVCHSREVEEDIPESTRLI
ncbi:MAG TPA: NDP-sugar synthase [Candidatus Bathyarchaeota archaeon]|nr:NDP-sugar synthase [Candidatus Bathyarchaeota archaeon]